ncbi:metallophosphoesterase family protein [Rhodothermus profundi]|uniref:Calcineurin-like phosphoesterase domain-containing protein n=1 Tax=Rhodothermus profundi TaxID=633813 RepID=A0A1M6T107_9BACT|nr:metallophosphoesterase [Rhodothermus profundi]SHK50468.1 hypothetical protein SAMN04488087_1308 [Rhodothermus profundi]
MREFGSLFAYLAPQRDGKVSLHRLEMEEITISDLPKAFQAVVAVSDLQGAVILDPRTGIIETEGLFDPSREVLESVVRDLGVLLEPMGVVLPIYLTRWLESREISVSQTLVLLAGDLCGVLEWGATCDVRRVWEAFAHHFPYVVGITGNHDLLDEPPTGTWLLDGEVLELKGLKIGGISGVVGRKDRNPRNRDAPTFRKVLEKILSKRPHVLLLHPCPEVKPLWLGDAMIAEVLQQYPHGLHVVCGHVEWPSSHARLGPHSVWNVDHRVILFRLDEEGGRS